MKTINEYLQTIKEQEHADQLKTVLDWVSNTFPQLKLKIAWNQPMFTDHDTYIIGFSAASKHFALASEPAILETFIPKIKAAGYSYSKHIFRITWNETVDYALLAEIITYTIEYKKACTTFWLK